MLDRIMNWLMDHVFDPEGYRQWQEACRKFDQKCAQIDALAARAEHLGLMPDPQEVAKRNPDLAARYPALFRPTKQGRELGDA